MAATPSSIPVEIQVTRGGIPFAPEEPLIEYRIEAFDGGIAPTHVYTTFGGWNIEGHFLCVYDPQGLKTAYAIPKGTSSLCTIEVPPRPTLTDLEESAVFEGTALLPLVEEGTDASVHHGKA